MKWTRKMASRNLIPIELLKTIQEIKRAIRQKLGRLIPYRIVHRRRVFNPETCDILPKEQYDYLPIGQFDYLPKGQYDYLPKEQYDYIPKGCVWGKTDQFLLVPKNRYRVVLLPGQERVDYPGVGCLAEDNSSEGFDLLWGNEDAVARYREEGGHSRERLTLEIVDHVEHLMVSEMNIVDIGCGIGDLLTEVKRRVPEANLAGCDFSPKAIERARDRLPDGRFIEHNITDKLPYDSEQFDLVLCTDFVEHTEHPTLIVEELVRICKEGGYVVIVVPDGSVDQFLGHLWFWNESSFGEFLSEWDASVTKLPDTGELLALINKVL